MFHLDSSGLCYLKIVRGWSILNGSRHSDSSQGYPYALGIPLRPVDLSGTTPHAGP